jgi:hypothetical protein
LVFHPDSHIISPSRDRAAIDIPNRAGRAHQSSGAHRPMAGDVVLCFALDVKKESMMFHKKWHWATFHSFWG